MLSRRVIACLDVRDGAVVKGVQFEGLATAGDPAELARRYNAEGIDELVILDVTATLEHRRALERTLRSVSAELFIPLAVGGGIRSEADAAAALDAGADKVALNTAALDDPSLLSTLAARYGSQAVVVAIDAKEEPGGYAVFARSGQTRSGGAGCRRDSSDIDRSRRHASGIRLRADGCGFYGRDDPCHRFRWGGDVRPFLRRVHGRLR